MKPTMPLIALGGALLLAGCVTPGGVGNSLVGQTWTVEDIAGHGVIDDAQATLLFGEDGRISGDTSCNRYFADYRLNGNSISIGNAGVTKRACAPAVMDQEHRFLDVLNAIDSFRIDSTGALILSTRTGLTMTARAETPAV